MKADTPVRHPPSPDRLWDQLRRETNLPRWTPDALRLLGIYATIRIVVLVADVLVAHINAGGNLDGPLFGWDAQHYMYIAVHGYPAVNPTSNGHLTYSVAGFEPLWPALVALFARATGGYVASALFVSLISGALGTLLVWRLAAALRGEVVGFNSAVLFVVFPGMAIAWGTFYSECLGLTLVAGALLLMYHKRWFWSGVVGALATATSPLALPLAVAALAPAVQSVRRRERPGALITAFLTPVGFLAFAGWLGIHYHDALFWWHLQNQAWGATVDFGKGLVLLLPHMWAGGYVGKAWLEWIGIVAVLSASTALWRAKLPAVVNLYCIAVGVLLLVSNQLGFKPRLLSWGFPALIAVASTVKRRYWQGLALGFAALLPIVLIAYLTIGNTMIQP